MTRVQDDVGVLDVDVDVLTARGLFERAHGVRRDGREVYSCKDTEINKNRQIYMNVRTNIHT